MTACAMCGNDSDKAFRVTTHDGRELAFDSFECAIHMLAPECARCGCRIVGHGAEHDGTMYCCAHCARQAGVRGIDDRA
jgi:hypothetical protein